MIVQEPLDSELLVGCTLLMIKFIPALLFEELISHPVEKPRDISQVLSRLVHRLSSSLSSSSAGNINSQLDRLRMTSDLCPRKEPQKQSNGAPSLVN